MFKHARSQNIYLSIFLFKNNWKMSFTNMWEKTKEKGNNGI